MGKESFSFHIFMFPFRFDHKCGNMEWHQMDLWKRTDSARITNCLPRRWQREVFETDVPGKYNEHVYFHDFAGDALFVHGAVKQDAGDRDVVAG